MPESCYLCWAHEHDMCVARPGSHEPGPCGCRRCYPPLVVEL